MLEALIGGVDRLRVLGVQEIVLYMSSLTLSELDEAYREDWRWRAMREREIVVDTAVPHGEVLATSRYTIEVA
jgi:hypothetical protein